MLSFGRKITSPGDPLQKISPELLFKGINQARPAFQDLIRQLRTLQSVDPAKYREQKKQLPYFVCALFHPSVRRKENFASIEFLILDLDHLSQAGLNREILTTELRQQPEVLMIFTSPGGDGLKVMFRLREPCRDAALFSAFYKLFALRFAQKWGLEPVIDLQTHDVTRACFASYDPDAWYRPDAEPIDIQNFIPALDFDQAEKDLKQAEKEIEVMGAQRTPPPSGPDAEVLNKIKAKLNPNYRPKEKQYHVPPEIDDALARIQEHLTQTGMQIIETGPISYGRKLKIGSGHLFAEINIFYGKKGYSVVQTTKSGSNPELAALAAQAIEEVLFT